MQGKYQKIIYCRFRVLKIISRKSSKLGADDSDLNSREAGIGRITA
jgi:hypothetical protein